MSGASLSSVRVLYVDDEPDFAELVADQLERDGGREGERVLVVETYTRPEAALDWLREGGVAEVDCIVSDYEMPGTNGLEFLEAVRDRWPDLPFVLFTGRGSENIASQAISRGVTEYMQKGTDPRQFEVLANRIRNAVEKYETERELERAETRYRRLVEQNLTGIYIIQDDDIVYANPKCEEIFGYSEGELVGTTVYDVIAEEDHDRLRENLRERETGEVEEMNYTLTGVREGGERFQFQVHSGRIDYGGEPAILGTLIDVTEQRRRERELEEYETIVQTAPDGIFIIDEDGYIVSGNETGAKLVGYDREALVGEHFGELVEADVVDQGTVDRYVGVIDELRSEDSSRSKAKLETTIRPPGGAERTCEMHIALLPADDGAFRGTVGVIRDITERKSIEEALRDERDRLSALFENIPEPTLVYEFEAGEPLVRRVNDAFEDVFGYDEATVLGECVDEYIVPGDRDEEAAAINERVSEGDQLDVETERRTADGEVRDFLFRNAPIGTEGVEGYAIYTDITERKERERRLGALHDATRDLMEATAAQEVAGIGLDAAERVLGLDIAAFYRYVDDPEGLEPVAATEDAAELFGEVPTIEAGDGIAWQVYERGEPLIADDIREEGDVYNPDTPARSEMILPLGDHGVFIAASTEVGTFDEADGSLAKVLVSNVETALDRAYRERLLREREKALLRQNERLEEFAGVVSHDLRSPLTVAKGNVYLLRNSGDEEYLDRIEHALERMERLIDDLLTLARQGETVDEPSLVELGHVIEDAWSMVDTAGATLETDLGDCRQLEADEGRLRELFENLFANAVEHGPATGRGATSRRRADGEPGRPADDGGVTVRVGTSEEGFYVEDDGEGLDEQAREKLFEPGFTTADEGTGFGLPIVKQIAEAHGWTVTAADSEEGGARFEFSGVEVPAAAEP